MALSNFIPLLSRAAPDFKLEPKTWVTDDKSFAMEVLYSGTQKGDFPGLPATGKPFSIRTCSFGEFENGKIKGRRDYWVLGNLERTGARKARQFVKANTN